MRSNSISKSSLHRGWLSGEAAAPSPSLFLLSLVNKTWLQLQGSRGVKFRSGHEMHGEDKNSSFVAIVEKKNRLVWGVCCKRRLHSLGLNTFLPLSGTVIASFPPFCPDKKQNNKQATKPDGEDEQQHARSTLESNNYHGNTAKRKSQDRNVVESTCIFVLNIVSWLNLNTSGQVNWINMKFKWADLFFFQSSQSLFVQRQIETKVTSRLFPIWATLNHTLSSKHLTKKATETSNQYRRSTCKPSDGGYLVKTK